jgi:hypothetical protein
MTNHYHKNKLVAVGLVFGVGMGFALNRSLDLNGVEKLMAAAWVLAMLFGILFCVGLMKGRK